MSRRKNGNSEARSLPLTLSLAGYDRPGALNPPSGLNNEISVVIFSPEAQKKTSTQKNSLLFIFIIIYRLWTEPTMHYTRVRQWRFGGGERVWLERADGK